MAQKIIHPDGWTRPRGYSHGILARGALLAVAGQIGVSMPDGDLAAGLPAQFAAALDNVLSVVQTAGGRPADVTSMTIFVRDLDDYRAATRDLGLLWRARFGQHYPAISLVEVSAFLHPEAVVEVQALAVLP